MDKRILIIESDKSILEALELTLTHEGYQTNSIQYMDRLKNVDWSVIELILIDHSMDAYKGHVLCTKFKAEDLSKHIPVILLSTHPHVQKISRDAGADGYLEKPFDIGRLLTVVSDYIPQNLDSF